MADRVKIAEFDIVPAPDNDIDAITEMAMRRHYWRMAHITFPGDVDFEVTPYGDDDLTGFLIQIYEQPNLPEEFVPNGV